MGQGGAASSVTGLGPWDDGSYFSANFTTNQAHLNTVYAPPASLSGWSFSRASQAYALTSAGVLTSFASGAPRITNRGLLGEGARTNRALWCRDLTNAAWTKTNTTAALTQTGAEGTANAATLITATGANGTVLQSVTNGSTARAISAWVKRVTGSGSVYITADNDTTRTDITSLINSSTYTLVQFNQTLANPVFGFKLATSGDAIAADFFGVEDGTGASSPIATTTASVTRAGDVVSIPYVTSYPASIVCEFEIDALTSASQELAQIDAGSGNDRVILVITSGGVLRADMVTGGATVASVTAGAAMSTRTIYRAAARFDTNNTNGVRSGTLGTNDTVCALPAASTTLRLGSTSAGTLQAHAYLRKLAIYNSALTDAQMQALAA
jgi:hypothetical protein